MTQNHFSRTKNLVADLAFDIAGGLILAVSIECFSSPNNIAPGGVSGLSVLVNYLTGIPISALTLLINIPLLIASWMFLGHTFTLRTLKSVAVLTDRKSTRLNSSH